MVGSLRLASRTWVPAMVPWRASEDGDVTPAVLAWYERFARGRPGALVVEATGVRDVASGPLLRISDDRFLPGLERLTECVRRASGGETKLFIQIIDFLSIRRRPTPQKYFERFLKVTPRHREFLQMPDGDEPSVRTRLASKPRMTGRLAPEAIAEKLRISQRTVGRHLSGALAHCIGRINAAD